MIRVVNPYNQHVVFRVPWDRIEPKLARARREFRRWSRTSLGERVRTVRESLDYFRANAEEIAREVTLQMGKPIAQARREVDTLLDRARYMTSIAAKTLAPERLPAADGRHLRIEHAPLGVVLDIAAWNYPLLIPINVIVPALLAGNTVLLKHSARTPVCGRRFEAAFGPLVQSVAITHAQTSSLIRDVDHVVFTGSTAGGREIYRRAADRLIDAGLELGGKDAAYVAEDADLAFAAENIVDGVCYNAGQSCCSVERVYVHRRRYSEFLRRAKAILERYRWGDPLDEWTTLGPLADPSAPARLERRVRQAVRRGARVLLGGHRLGGNFFAPTLIADVPNDAELMQEESFGPVLPARAVSGDDEALARMSDTRYGLTASVWTRSRARAERIARELDVGTVFQNRCDFLEPSLAWTGVRESGLGSTLSRYGYYALTRRKSLHFR